MNVNLCGVVIPVYVHYLYLALHHAVAIVDNLLPIHQQINV